MWNRLNLKGQLFFAVIVILVCYGIVFSSSYYKYHSVRSKASKFAEELENKGWSSDEAYETAWEYYNLPIDELYEPER